MTITRRNKPRLVILSIEDYRRLAAHGDTRKSGTIESMSDELFDAFREAAEAYRREPEDA